VCLIRTDERFEAMERRRMKQKLAGAPVSPEMPTEHNDFEMPGYNDFEVSEYNEFETKRDVEYEGRPEQED
jgi:hypothetical protein